MFRFPETQKFNTQVQLSCEEMTDETNKAWTSTLKPFSVYKEDKQ
jgi:hypothetical protein